MKYVSTRGSAPSLDFAGVTLAGLASDGGLYVPAQWPRFTHDEIAAMRGLPYSFRLMTLSRRIRGTVLDPFRYSKDRVFDQQLVRDYEQTVSNLCAGLSASNLDAAIEIALLQQSIRGFGHIKSANASKAQTTAEKLWSEFEMLPVDVENAA